MHESVLATRTRRQLILNVVALQRVTVEENNLKVVKTAEHTARKRFKLVVLEHQEAELFEAVERTDFDRVDQIIIQMKASEPREAAECTIFE